MDPIWRAWVKNNTCDTIRDKCALQNRFTNQLWFINVFVHINEMTKIKPHLHNIWKYSNSKIANTTLRKEQIISLWLCSTVCVGTLLCRVQMRLHCLQINVVQNVSLNLSCVSYYKQHTIVWLKSQLWTSLYM